VKPMLMADFNSELSLELQLERLALEANFLPNVIASFKKTVNSLFAALKDSESAIKGLLDKKEVCLADIKIYGESIKITDKIIYTNYGERLISKPENFQGHFLDYAEVLNTVASDLYKLRSEIMPQYIGILSSFLTNKDDKISLKDYNHVYARVANERTNVTNKLKQFFPKDNGLTKVEFKKVIARLADLKPLYSQTTTLAKLQNKSNLTIIQNDVTQCTELLNMLIDEVNNGTITNISSNAALNIADGAYEIAKFVELIGIVYFDTMVFVNIVNRLAEEMVEFSKK
jgi:hypothetical protein